MEVIYLSIAGLFTGMARAGMVAMGSMATPFLTFVLPSAKQASGLVVVFFVIGDVGAILYYHKKIVGAAVLKILSFTFIGMYIAFVFGKYISNEVFLISITILNGIALVFLIIHSVKKYKGIAVIQHKGLAHHVILISCGIVAGISTVLGNGAAIFLNLYLFELGFKKNELIGTLTFSFFIINIVKLLAHLFYWQSIAISDAYIVLPYSIFILAGLFFGILFVRKLHELAFSNIILFSGALGFVLLIIKTISLF